MCVDWLFSVSCVKISRPDDSYIKEPLKSKAEPPVLILSDPGSEHTHIYEKQPLPHINWRFTRSCTPTTSTNPQSPKSPPLRTLTGQATLVMWSVLRPVPALQKAAGHKSLSVPPVTQTVVIYPPTQCCPG